MKSNACIIFFFLCGSTASITLAQEEQKGPVKKTIDAADHAAIRGADRLDKMGQGIEVRIEKFVNPPPHQGGQKNIVSSALSGVGRLLRNVSVEGGKFAGTVGEGALKFSKGSAKAMAGTLKESAKRIASPRKKKVDPYTAPQVVVIEQQVAPLPSQQPQQQPIQVQPAPAPAPAAAVEVTA